MSVCCNSDVRGQVTSELFGMNGIAVHAVTLTVNAVTGSRFNLAVWQRNLKPWDLLSSPQPSPSLVLREHGGTRRDGRASGQPVALYLRLPIDAVDIAVGLWWCTVTEHG